MAAAATMPIAELEQAFSVDQLYELQRRKGRPAQPKYSYEMRNNLKAKFRTQHRADNEIRHYLYQVTQDFSDVISALFCTPLSCAQWIGYRLWGYQGRVSDIRSGRSRFENFRPSAPRELSKPLYDPYKIDRH